ncbi:uncharacterized protein FYW47_012909 [Aplochiton taeniatus]
MRQDVGLCVRLSAPGPHAFLLVLPVEPSEKEERRMMERMEEMFGEGCWGHTVILFTHADILTEQRIEEFLQAGSPDLQQLVEKCGHRFHVLNIKDGAQGTQVSKLLDQIEEMVSGNTESFYSTQTYQEAETQVREMERKIHREREERKQREEEAMKERIEKELQDSLNKMEVVIQEHEGDIRTLNHRTTELERQIKEEREEEKKRELERELKRESDRREEIETKLEKFREKREDERREMEERHRQEMEEMRENYEEEAKVEAKNLTTVLCELQRNIMIAQNKMKRDGSRDQCSRAKEEWPLRSSVMSGGGGGGGGGGGWEETGRELRRRPGGDLRGETFRKLRGTRLCLFHHTGHTNYHLSSSGPLTALTHLSLGLYQNRSTHHQQPVTFAMRAASAPASRRELRGEVCGCSRGTVQGVV